MSEHQSEFQGLSINNNGDPILEVELVHLLAAARPRLIYFARKQGIAADLVEDVVQETLVEAWNRLDYLREPARFNAWLNGICHNVCLRWLRKLNRHVLPQESLSHFGLIDEMGNVREGSERDLADPLALDPAEELARQDLALLLDRAMSHLSPATRLALELCYLADLPPAEVASRLGLSVNALEVRLHRARRQLRLVLSSTLRDEAQAFGLALDGQMAEGWRQSRLWCFLCGRHRLSGRFQEEEDGSINLLMRCPGCSFNVVDFNGMGSMGNLRSFRPAMKRGLLAVARACRKVIENDQAICPICGTASVRHTIEPLDFGPPYMRRYCLTIDCPRCGSYILSSIMSASLANPAATLFMEQHPRWITEPEDVVEHAGCSVVRVRLADAVSANRLSLLIQPGTVKVMEAIKE